MKDLLFIFFLAAPFMLPAQKGFIITNSDTFPDSYGAYLHSKYRNPVSVTELTLSLSDFDSLSAYDLSRLTNLRQITVSFTLDPQSMDSLRIPFVNELTNHIITWLPLFAKKCPKLEMVYFKIGEQVFLSDNEKKEFVEKFDKGGADKNEGKRRQRNLENAWKAFGMSIKKDMRDIKLYAYDWGW